MRKIRKLRMMVSRIFNYTNKVGWIWNEEGIAFFMPFISFVWEK